VTVTWTSDQLFLMSDWGLNQGGEQLPVVQAFPLDSELGEGQTFYQGAAMAHPLRTGPGLVAASSQEQDVFLFRLGQKGVARVKSSVLPSGIALSQSTVPQLALFSSAGISVADVPPDFSSRTVVETRVVDAQGICGGISLQRDDFVAYDLGGTVRRYRSNRVEKLGVVPTGIRSLSGYLDGRVLRLWAVDSQGGIWAKLNKDQPIELEPVAFPPNVTARSVSAAGQAVFLSSEPLGGWSDGYFAHRTHRQKFPGKTWVERLFFVGSDGRLYTPFPMDGLPQGRAERPLRPVADGFGRPLFSSGGPTVQDERVLAMSALEKHNPGHRGNGPLLLQVASDASLWAALLADPKSKLAERVSSFGVAPFFAAQLIFLLCLEPGEVESLIDGRAVQAAEMKEIARLLLLPRSEFLNELPTNPQAQNLIRELARRFTFDSIDLVGEGIHYLNETHQDDESLYLAIDAFLRKQVCLWQWDLSQELRNRF
jgi:hypothetical protein